MVTQTYQQAAWELLEQGLDELGAGDVRQASEKGWGAAAQMVKAVAQQRGWTHTNHGALFAAVRRLVRETGKQDIEPSFAAASALHVNFYESWMSAEYVAEELTKVRLLLEALQPMIE